MTAIFLGGRSLPSTEWMGRRLVRRRQTGNRYVCAPMKPGRPAPARKLWTLDLHPEWKDYDEDGVLKAAIVLDIGAR